MEVQFGRTVPRDIAAKEPTRRQLVEQKVEEITSKAAANRKEKKPLTPEQIAAKDARLDVRVARVNSKLDPTLQLDPARVKEAAMERNYDHVFYDRLGKIERTAEKGGFTPQPYEYLTTGRVAQMPQLRTSRAIDPNREFPTALPTRREEPEQAAGMQALERSIKNLGTAMAPKGRMQDVRSDAEKEQEWEL